MAYINIPIKDNNTPLSPAEFNYLVDKINARKLRNLVDVQDSNPVNKNIIRHNGSGWVYYDIEEDFYTKQEVDEIITEGIATVAPTEFDYIDFNANVGVKEWKEGRMYYDSNTKGWVLYNNEPETSLNLGEEQRVRVYNNNSQTILNGQAVTVTGTTVDGVIEVHKAIANDEVSALNTIGVATHDIEVGTYGWVTVSGQVKGIDTSAYTEGAALFLSDSIAGAYQETRPVSPSYEVRIGGIQKSHATDGIIYVEPRVISNDQDNNGFYNGSILEPNKVDIISNGTTVNCSLVSLSANNRLSIIVAQKYINVTSGININLILGTDSLPVHNFVYLDGLGDIQTSTSGFPTASVYVPIARCIVPSALTAQSKGLYKVHAYTDHLTGGTGQGHLTHINEWIRKREANWIDGVVLSTSVAENIAANTINLAYTSGNVAQLHDHSFPSINTNGVDDIIVINNFANPYTRRQGLTSNIDTDSKGVSIGNNKYYSVVIWGVVSEDLNDCQIFMNLPSGSYTNISDALNDVSKYTNYAYPNIYKGTAFLITKLTLQRTSTQVMIVGGGIKDLRGSFPSSSGGGTIGGAGITKWTELIDTPISITPNKLVKGNTAGTSLEFSDAVSPISKALVSNQVLNSYNTATGVFTSIQPTFASLASKPTTISGYGITDFNSLGDTRWLGKTAKAADSFLLNGVSWGNVNTTIKTNSNFVADNGSGDTVIDIRNSAHNWTNNSIYIESNIFQIQSKWSAGATNLALQPNNGNVGIGTISPLSKLEIANGTGGEQLRFTRGTGGIRVIQDNNSDSLYFYNKAASINFLTLKSSGNIGIDVINPSTKLHIRTLGTSNPTAGGTVGSIIRLENNYGGGFGSGGELQFSTDDSNLYSAIKGAYDAYSSFVGGSLSFYTRSSVSGSLLNRMIIKDSGNVGIGTSSPTEILEIYKSVGYASSGEVFSSIGINEGAVDNGSAYKWRQGLTGNNAGQDFVLSSIARLGSWTERVRVKGNGNVGIGTTNPAYKLDVIGTGRFTGDVTAPDFVGSSDKRLKENIENFIPKKINSQYKTFNFIADEIIESRVGVIAQEIEVENPEFVRTSEDGFKSVSYSDLHSAEIAYLKSENEELKRKLDLIINKLGI